MTNSPKMIVPEIYTALSEIQKIVAQKGIPKTRSIESNNANFKNYMYRGIEDIYNFFTPLFAEKGILCKPDLIESKTTQLIVDILPDLKDGDSYC